MNHEKARLSWVGGVYGCLFLILAGPGEGQDCFTEVVGKYTQSRQMTLVR